MNTSPFEPTIWQIIRSSQKDEQYIDKLTTDLNHSVKALFGVRFWLRAQDLLASGNKLLYYLLTSASGHQTLGEEYCNILQVSTSQPSVPSRAKSLSLAALYAFHSTLLNKFAGLLHILSQKYFRSNYPLDELRKDVQYAVNLLQAMNLAIFYFNRTYLDLSKRILSIGYLSTYQRQTLFDASRSTSTLLGSLSLLQIVLSLYSKYNLLWKTPNCEPLTSEQLPPSTSEPNGSLQSGLSNCLLCFSKRTNPTLIECGHIFCWPCLTGWLQYKNECPTCRRAVRSSRLVFLHNYQ